MAYYMIKWEGSMYINNELFIEAIAGGRYTFIKMLSCRAVIGKKLFDQMLYPITPNQEEQCLRHTPFMQDFDEAYRGLSVVSKEAVKQVKAHMDAGYPNAIVITIPKHVLSLYTYRQTTFFKVLDYKAQRKYKMLSKMAAVKVCGRLYVALNAVSVRVETPIIATLGA
jgi:hypothetical protein